MENSQTPAWRWPLFLAGAIVFLLGPIGYAVQVGLARLEFMPWYLFGCFAVGVLLMFMSVLQRGGVLRMIGLVLFALVGGLATFMFLVAFKAPDYAGLAKAGATLPPFTTTLADGTPFANADLKNGKPTVLIFFRGRW